MGINEAERTGCSVQDRMRGAEEVGRGKEQGGGDREKSMMMMG